MFKKNQTIKEERFNAEDASEAEFIQHAQSLINKYVVGEEGGFMLITFNKDGDGGAHLGYKVSTSMMANTALNILSDLVEKDDVCAEKLLEGVVLVFDELEKKAKAEDNVTEFKGK